jgi:hypothetical protein
MYLGENSTNKAWEIIYYYLRYINYKDLEKLLKNSYISIIILTKKQIIPQGDTLYKIYLAGKIKEYFHKKTDSRSEKRTKRFYIDLLGI